MLNKAFKEAMLEDSMSFQHSVAWWKALDDFKMMYMSFPR